MTALMGGEFYNNKNAKHSVAKKANLADKFIMYHNINIGKNYCNSLTFGLFEDMKECTHMFCSLILGARINAFPFRNLMSSSF